MHLKYCDVVNICQSGYMVVGRHLNLEKKEADVANSLVYKCNQNLYIIDTGAVESFGHQLLTLCKSLEPYDKAILINTHGHGDHVGNNAILKELSAKSYQHLISTHDLEMMRDNLSFFEYDFKTIEPYLDGKTSREQVASLLTLFEPLYVDTPYLETLESLKVKNLQIGSIFWSGWSLNNDIMILKSQGHSAGHVIIYFPKIKHMHMGDETNGYCNLFHDCDHLKSLESHTKVLSMINEGTVISMSDGHTFAIHHQEEATKRLRSLVDGHYVFTNFIRELCITSTTPLTLDTIYHQLCESEIIQALPAGANPNPTYSKLQILSKLRDLGIKGDCKDLTKARFKFPC